MDMDMDMDIKNYNEGELIPRLPEDVAIECLTRLPYSAHRLTSQVCKRWHHLLQTQQFYAYRKLTGRTQNLCCFIQAITPPSYSSSSSISHSHSHSKQQQQQQLIYGISVFDPLSETWDRIDPLPKYSFGGFGLPLFCQIAASTDGKLFIIGGLNPSTCEAVKQVFMYDFITQTWTQCADMPPCNSTTTTDNPPSPSSFFAVGAMEGGRLFIAGGHDQNKKALKSSWMFDIKTNVWTELPPMSEERDECEGMVIGSEFWVVSGYETQNQGSFKDSADVFQIGGGGWKRVEGAWGTSRSPRSCVGVGGDGKFISWGDSFDHIVQLGICGVEVDDRVVITGSGYRGTSGHEVFVAQKKSNGNGIGELRKIKVPHHFSGFVQSGCCIHI